MINYKIFLSPLIFLFFVHVHLFASAIDLDIYVPFEVDDKSCQELCLEVEWVFLDGLSFAEYIHQNIPSFIECTVNFKEPEPDICLCSLSCLLKSCSSNADCLFKSCDYPCEDVYCNDGTCECQKVPTCCINRDMCIDFCGDCHPDVECNLKDVVFSRIGGGGCVCGEYKYMQGVCPCRSNDDCHDFKECNKNGECVEIKPAPSNFIFDSFKKLSGDKHIHEVIFTWDGCSTENHDYLLSVSSSVPIVESELFNRNGGVAHLEHLTTYFGNEFIASLACKSSSTNQKYSESVKITFTLEEEGGEL